MKILLVGHGGVYNRGCEAIIRTSLLMFKENFSNLSVVLASFDYENDVKYDLGFPVKVIPHSDESIWKIGTKGWLKRQFAKLIGKDLAWDLLFEPIEKYVKEADVVISVGGDNYTEDYGISFLKMFMGLNTFVKQRGKKLVIWGASVGPFSDKSLQLGVVDNLKRVDHITARESKTAQYLNRLGLTNVTWVTDPTFLLPVQVAPLPEFMERKAKVILGFNVSPLLKIYLTNGSKDSIHYETVTFLRERLLNDTINIVLLPHVVDNRRSGNDDYAYLKQIYDELPCKDRVFLVPSTYNAQQMKFIISQCDLYFGARTHSTISALSSAVPTISIGYSVKSNGINEDIFGHQDFVLSIKDYSAQELLRKYSLINEKKDIVRAHLQSVLPRIKKMANSNVEVLKEIMSS